VLNLLALYQLGTLVESWYGAFQLMTIYGLTGGGGNLIAALLRYWTGQRPDLHSGGGSVVNMGLVALCAVVGWRSKDRRGILLSQLMLAFLLVTALLGLVFPKYIDNWGHAGGVLVGFALGLVHGRLVKNFSKPAAWGGGVLTGLIIAGSGAAQFAADWREAPLRREIYLARRSFVLQQAAWSLQRIGQLVPLGKDLPQAINELDEMKRQLDGSAQARIPGLRAAVEAARRGPLSKRALKDFEARLAGALEAIRKEHDLAQRELRRLQRSQSDRRARRPPYSAFRKVLEARPAVR
jgi:hypothetical protein